MEFAGALLLGHSRLAYIFSPTSGKPLPPSHVKVHPFQPSRSPSHIASMLESSTLSFYAVSRYPLYASTCTLQLTHLSESSRTVSPPGEVALQPICLPSFQRLMESRITTLASVRTGILVTRSCRAVAQARRPVPKFELPYYP